MFRTPVPSPAWRWRHFANAPAELANFRRPMPRRRIPVSQVHHHKMGGPREFQKRMPMGKNAACSHRTPFVFKPCHDVAPSSGTQVALSQIAMIRILIVDDEQQLLKNLASYLASFPEEFQVTTSSTAEEGAEIMALQEVDVLLTDVRLPGMSGIDLVRHVANRHPHISVAVMTAYSSPKTKNAAFHEGALRFIEKPLDLKELRSLLLELGSAERGWSGQVQGLDLFDFAQLMLWGRKTKAIRVSSKNHHGTLAFKRGQLIHAAAKGLAGNEAFFHIAQWADGSFEDLPADDAKGLPQNVSQPLEFLLMEAAKRRDDTQRDRSNLDSELEAGGADPPQSQAIGQVPPETAAQEPKPDEKEKEMAIPKTILNALNSDVEGLEMAALFGSDGLPLLMNNPGKADVDAVSAKFAMVSKLVSKTVQQLHSGRLDEILVEQDKGWILVRPIGKADLNLIISVSSEATLGNLRLVAKNLVSEIGKAV